MPAPPPIALPLPIDELLADKLPLLLELFEPTPIPARFILPEPVLEFEKLLPCKLLANPLEEVAAAAALDDEDDEFDCFEAVDDLRCLVVDAAFILVVILMLVAEVDEAVAFMPESSSFSGDKLESDDVSCVMGL